MNNLAVENLKAQWTIYVYFKPRGRFYCLFIDFLEAFDRVSHLLLFHRLIITDIHGEFLKILKSMYSQLFACVS